jgi:hypothetical protein
MISLARPDNPYRATVADFFTFVIAYVDLLAARCEELDEGWAAGTRSVPLAWFLSRGIGPPTLLWMLYQGHVDHLQPAGEAGGGLHVLAPVDSVLLGETSAFALSGEGERFAGNFLGHVFSELEDLLAGWDLLVLGHLVPKYEREGRVFSWGNWLLKCFRQPSINQEIILCAAEELGWPAWFDDPLPRVAGLSPKVRLHDALKALNRHQLRCCVRFRGDGTGTRVGWECR